MHSNAHGFGIAASNLDIFIQKINKIYTNISREPIYWVDYIWKTNEITSNKLLELADMAPYWGQDIPASQIAIIDIDLSRCQINLCGQKNNTIRMTLPNGIVGVKFGVTQEQYEAMLESNTYMTCVASPQRNEFNGNVSGEFIINDYYLETKWVF